MRHDAWETTPRWLRLLRFPKWRRRTYAPAMIGGGFDGWEYASAAASAETPHPSPVDYTEVVERLNWSSVAVGTDGQWVSIRREVRDQAAQVIEAQAAENERKRQIIDTWHTSFLVAEERRLAAEARIAELEKERENRVIELKMTPITEGLPKRDELRGEQTILTYCEPTGTWDLAFYESGWDDFDDGFRIGVTHWLDISEMWPGVIAQVAEFDKDATTRAETAESRLADAVKVIEDLMETGFNVAETPARQRARSFLSTGGDSQ